MTHPHCKPRPLLTPPASTPIATVDTYRGGVPLRIAPKGNTARFEAQFTVEDGGKFYRATVYDNGELEAGFVFRAGRRLPDGHKRNVQAAALDAYRAAFHGTPEQGAAAAAAHFARFRSRRPLGDYMLGTITADHGTAYLVEWDRLAAEYDAAETARLDGYARDAAVKLEGDRARRALAVDLGEDHTVVRPMPGLRGPVTSSRDVHELPPGYRPQHGQHVHAWHDHLIFNPHKARGPKIAVEPTDYARTGYATLSTHAIKELLRCNPDASLISFGDDPDMMRRVVAEREAPPVRVSRIRRQNGIGELIARARARGAVVRFTIDRRARREEGRSIIQTVTVTGLRGVGPHPMGLLGAVERLSEALTRSTG